VIRGDALRGPVEELSAPHATAVAKAAIKANRRS